jgi:hypothetical protein
MSQMDCAFTLTCYQKKAIELLASGCTVRYTALVLGLKASTVSGWVKQDDPFRAKLAAREQELLIPIFDDRARVAPSEKASR